jgi:type IV pilus assembly protein PilM
VYLSGGTARLPALVKAIEARAGVPVEVMNPFRSIDVDHKRFDPALLESASAGAAVAVGLALRRLGDK